MTIRDEVLAAADALTSRGDSPFSPAEVIAEARRRGCTASEATIRSGVVHNMRADLGNIRTRGFFKVAPAKYALSEPAPIAAEGAPSSAPIGAPQQPSVVAVTQLPDPPPEWSWEGNVQAAVVRAIAADGWDILRVAGTASREHGIDIEAQKSGQRLVIEVKGYPSAFYARGPDKGLRKPTSPPTQARTWFSNGVVTALGMRGDEPNARVVAAFPDKETYRNLGAKVIGPLRLAGVEVWLMSEDGKLRSL